MRISGRGLSFSCSKRPAVGSRGMVVANHPLASAAGAEMLLAGGNAIDAAIATLFALTVVEPMMVGLLGGGVAHIRLADGRHIIFDSLSTAPRSAHPHMYQTLSDRLPNYRDVRDRANLVGPLAVAVPGALAGWVSALEQFGTLSLGDVIAPAIRFAQHGFVVTPYLSNCISDSAVDLASDPGLASLFLPGDAPLAPGMTLRQPEYASTLRFISENGASALYNGPLGSMLSNYMREKGGMIEAADLEAYRIAMRDPIRGSYRGFEIVGPPPPSSSGVHIVQMLNILEGYDIARMGFGSVDVVHLLAETLKIAFADRAAATADPSFIDVPVDRLIAKAYAGQRRGAIEMLRAKTWSAGIQQTESPNTTHVTVADSQGNVVSTTQTINSLFGACVQIPGTGMIANNYMYNFDPHPGLALSIAPGKRVFTSMAPMMALRDGKLVFALGLPGGLRIFPSALQAIINLIDHRMSLQEAVEAPRVWTEGGALELEAGISDEVGDELAARGHDILRVKRVAGGMNAIGFEQDGMMTGAACWRADGTPVGISGGLASSGVGFTIA